MPGTPSAPPAPPGVGPRHHPPRRRRWWPGSGVAAVAVVVAAFVGFSLPPYLSLDPTLSRVPAPDGFGAHFPLLVAHVCFGVVAMLTAILQIWPWFRRRYRTAHRVVGRVYVFGGVVPAALSALPIGALSPFGPVARVSNVLLAVLWLSCTVIGHRRARQRRYAEHRRWMIRSVVLTMSIIANRLWAAAALVVLAPALDTTFQGNETLFSWTVAGISTWAGWTIPLLVTQYYLDRGDARTARARGTR